MDKFVQLINAILCLSEFHKLNKREYRFHGIREAFDSLTGSIVFILILSVGIFMGLIHIPTYLGDGYGYDNFDRQKGNVA